MSVVAIELLERYSGPQKEPDLVSHGRKAGDRPEFDIEGYMSLHDLRIRNTKAKGGGILYELEVCPFNPTHPNPGASFIQRMASGALVFGCQYNGCKGQNWRTLRERLEPFAQRVSASPGRSADARVPIAPDARDENELLTWDSKIARPVLDEAALFGLAGRFVRLVMPHSEADAAGLLSMFLAIFGCAIGPARFFYVEATKHVAKIFVLVIGQTSIGRKGTALGRCMQPFRLADPEWLANGEDSGFGSGESIIKRLSDEPDDGTKPDEVRKPVEKRMLILEPEFARPLTAMTREGSIISATIRELFDGDTLRARTVKVSRTASGCHGVFVGQITSDELRRNLTSTEIANGFINRFLMVVVSRRQRLPHGGSLTDEDFAPIVAELQSALTHGRIPGRMRRTPAANAWWERFYYAVPEPEGLLGAATGRAEAIVLRLSMAYALLDESDEIDVPHLEAAEALWRYGFESAQFVFGASLGDDVADRILQAARERYPYGLTRSDIHTEVFKRHGTAARIQVAVDALAKRGLIVVQRSVTRGEGGRPAEHIFATRVGSSAVGQPSQQSAVRERSELSERTLPAPPDSDSVPRERSELSERTLPAPPDSDSVPRERSELSERTPAYEEERWAV